MVHPEDTALIFDDCEMKGNGFQNVKWEPGAWWCLQETAIFTKLSENNISFEEKTKKKFFLAYPNLHDLCGVIFKAVFLPPNP